MKARFSYTLFVLGWVFFFTVHSSGGAPSDTSLCGPKSLQIALRSQGIAAGLQELCSLTGYDPKTGTTMLGLYEAAQAKKVPVAAIRTELRELCRFGESTIVFVDGNHFLVVYGCDKDKILIEDPFTGKHSQAKTDFQKRWNGETLVFGRAARAILATRKVPAPAPAARGPKIRFDTVEKDFGTVDEGSVLTHRFTFHNDGSDTLSVTARSTCSCTVALLSDKRIPPGGTGKVRMEFKTQERKGPTSQSIHVRTNDPASQMLTLTMTALIRSSVKVVPERVWLDDVPAGAVRNREVLVVDSGDGRLEVASVRTSAGVTAKVLPSRKDRSGLRVIPVALTVSSGTPGAFEKVVTICTNDLKRKEIPVTIAGVAQAKVTAFPPRLFFGEVKRDSVSKREFILSGRNGEKIEGVRVSAGSPLVSFDLVPMENGTKYKVIASLNAARSAVTVRDSVSIYLADSKDPVIDIPLYARIVP